MVTPGSSFHYLINGSPMREHGARLELRLLYPLSRAPCLLIFHWCQRVRCTAAGVPGIFNWVGSGISSLAGIQLYPEWPVV